MWHRIADTLGGRTVAEWQRVMGSREFVRWCRYFVWKRENPSIDQHYLAQIAMEVRRSYIKEPVKAILDHFLLKWEGKPQAQTMTPEQRVQNSKNYWLGLVSFFSGKKDPPKKKD